MKETLPLDMRGHLFSRDPIETIDVLRDLEFTGDLILGEARMSWRCGWCGVLRDLKIDGDTVRPPEPCPIPDGVTTVTRLAVPSGKIVVYDDLREFYTLPGKEEDYADYNTALGQHQVVEAYATVGLAYGPVSNTCPGLYRTGEDTYTFASPDYDEDKGDRVLPDGWTHLAWVVTDLWAYCVADLDDFRSKGGVLDTNRYNGPEVVDVRPGTYEVTPHTGEKDFDHYADGTVIFADIKRIGD